MENHIERCLSSLVVQDANLFSCMEILVINDGSHDKTSQIAHSFESKHPDVISVIDKPNGHYGSCINVGMKHATSEFVKILDADDHFNTAGLKLLLAKLESIHNSGCQIDAVLSDYQVVDTHDNILKTQTYEFPSEKPFSIEDLTSSNSDRQMHATTYRRSLFDNLKYIQTEGIAYTDSEWMFLPMSSVQNLVYYKIPVYMYVVGRQDQSMDSNVIAKQIPMLERTLQTKVREYLSRKSEFTPEAISYTESQLAREIARLYFLFIKLNSRASIARLDTMVDSQLIGIKGKIGFDGALFTNPLAKIAFAKGCCQHHGLRWLFKKILNRTQP